MFSLLFGYMLGIYTTYCLEDIFNLNIKSINLKTKLNQVLEKTVYKYIDTFELNSRKQHQETRDLVEDLVNELKDEIENKKWHEKIQPPSP